MRLISCTLTVDPVLTENKTETRRLGWRYAKVGDRLIICEKVMGLGPGGRPRPLRCVELVGVRREPLHDIDDAAVVREGFGAKVDELRRCGPAAAAAWFVGMFCREMRCETDTVVTVLRWRYLRHDELSHDEREQWDRRVQQWIGRVQP